MTFAPALTWMHLFPAGASYACDPAVPGWFRDLVRPAAGGRSADVRVAFADACEGLVASGADGVVAVNCPAATGRRLEAAGFTYVRRFAALPNLTNARWFIPLDTPAVAAAAFGIYSPTRLSARAKRAAARFAARLNLPVWYRDSVCIAQRRPPPLERQLAGGADIRLALSAGAPEPARNRKASAAVLRLDGTVYGFAKLAGSPLATTLVQREANVLATLAGRPAVARSVPRPLSSGEADGRFFLVQSPMAGRAAPARLTDAHRRFLAALHEGPPRPAAESEMVRTLAPRLAAVGAHDLLALARSVAASLDRCVVSPTVVHGDFAPWNLRVCPDGELAAFDWEYGRLDGLPEIDATHHELQVGYLLNRWTTDDAARALDARAADHPDLAPHHVIALQNVYLLDVLTRLAEEGYAASDPMIQWHRALLEGRVAVATPGAA